MAKKVAIFGGGVAGLSAAHELAHRGFEVIVYESRRSFGGKAASQAPKGFPAPAPNHLPLPGEHGFRFFPGFYRNVIATMNEIPRSTGSGVVGEDLVPSNNAGITWKGSFYTFPRRNLGPSWDVLGRMRKLFGALDFTPTDLARMTWFRLKYLTAGPKRRLGWDKDTWWTFIDGNSPHYSPAFRDFERSIPRTMSAMIADSSSAKVIGDITMQFLLGYGRPGNEEDRLLIGPSSERWIESWRAYLKLQNVTFHASATLDHFEYVAGSKTISGAAVKFGTKPPVTITADYYVAALPIEVMKEQVTKAPGLKSDDAKLAALAGSPASTSWMVGAQFYLATDQPMVDGHVFYPKTPWALTSVSQAQFWEKSGKPFANQYGNGNVRGVLSVIISDWDTPDVRNGLTAKNHTSAASILEEVRLQLEDELGPNADFSTGNIVHRHLDENLVVGSGYTATKNLSPLLVHPPNGLSFRPDAKTEIGNLFLCGDYVARARCSRRWSPPTRRRAARRMRS